jgi:type IV fimbrial biogenesis protein FimT
MKHIFMSRQTQNCKGLEPRHEPPRMQLSVKHAKQLAGFTLVELMVTLSLLAIILGFAVPGLQTLVTSYRVSTLANEFTSGLSYARGQAVNKNMCTMMCISANTTAANPTCSPTLTNWGSGWIIFADPDCNGGGNGVRDELLQVYEGKASGPTLSTQGGRRNITFISRGTLRAPGAADAFVIRNDANATTDAKRLCMDMAGRVRVGSDDLLPNCN